MMRNASGDDPRSSMSESALDAANGYAMPQVGGGSSERMTTVLGFAVLAMLGVFVFNQMSEGRRTASIDALMEDTRAELNAAQTTAENARREADQARTDAQRAQQRLAVNAQQSQAAPTKRKTADLPGQANLRSPALVVDNSRPRATAAGDGEGAAGAIDAAINGLTASDVFAQRVSADGLEPVRATVISEPSRVAPQGTIIAGVLETAINSDLPGFTRAVVSEDIRSLDSRTVLIPRGSRLIGQYRSGLVVGESRAFVIWTRLLTPDGVSVELASPATDTLGRAGLAGKVNRHFFQRFGAAFMLSVIDIGANAIIYDNNSSIVIGSTSEAQAIAAQALSQQISIPPTIKVKQGTEIRIFLARDLYFPRLANVPSLRQ